ncbi:MAG: helix-turn-helix domain-containing protein [Methanosarcinales archaeon]|nr:MAG: helix-turn-helix domain-containing protein [Methanosarcinales archaeon]
MNENVADVRNRLAEKMAGEITLSDNPGETLKKWRKNFDISQTNLSDFLDISPSVISDYESGRRKSPGTLIVSKIIEGILELDARNGAKKIRSYQNILRSEFNVDIIYDIHEYATPVRLDNFAELIQAEKITGDFNKTINGHTMIDGPRAILELSSNEFFRLYGWSTERALVFTNVSTGKSPLVAIRVTNLRPGVVVLHGLKMPEVDPIAIKIAEIEGLPLMITHLAKNELIDVLRNLK